MIQGDSSNHATSVFYLSILFFNPSGRYAGEIEQDEEQEAIGRERR